MLDDWIPQGTIYWLERHLMIVIDENGKSVKGYGIAKNLCNCKESKVVTKFIGD